MKKTVILSFLSIILLLLFTSCADDKFSKKLLCSSLSSDYTANLEFIISGSGENTIGKASVTKGKISTLTFTEPQNFQGISVTSDEAGNPDVFLLEFSGIPATVPKSIASEISLLFSLFSNSVYSEVNLLDEDCFSQNDNGTNEVFFTKNGMNYKIKYDASSGIPNSFEAGNEAISVSIIISDFTVKN